MLKGVKIDLLIFIFFLNFTYLESKNWFNFLFKNPKLHMIASSKDKRKTGISFWFLARHPKLKETALQNESLSNFRPALRDYAKDLCEGYV